MRAYFSYFKLTLARGFQYKSAAIAGIATQFFFGLMYIMVYKAFYDASTVSAGMSYSELTTYVWVGQIFFAMLYIAITDNQIFEMIKNGNIAYELCRPINIYYFWFAKAFAKRISAAALRMLPTLIISAFILPYPYNLAAPESAVSFLLFLITLFLGVIIICAMVNIIQILTFFTLNEKGVASIIFVIIEFFAGGVVPIIFMPKLLQTIAFILPFRLTYDLPLRTYIGNIDTIEAIQSIGLQVVWISIFILLGNYLMKRITNKVIIQGG